MELQVWAKQALRPWARSWDRGSAKQWDVKRECTGGSLCRELDSWRSIRGSSPRDLCIDTSLDPDQRSRVASELCMMGLEQVLSHHRKLHLPGSPPGQMRVRRAITAH